MPSSVSLPFTVMVSLSGTPMSFQKPGVLSLVNVMSLPAGILSELLVRVMSAVRVITVGSVAALITAISADSVPTGIGSAPKAKGEIPLNEETTAAEENNANTNSKEISETNVPL